MHYFWHPASQTARWSLNLADPDSGIDALRGEGRGAGGGGGGPGTNGYGWAALAPPGHATAYTKAKLPQGWEKAWSDAHQEPFFWHPATRSAEWTLNLAAAARVPAASGLTPLVTTARVTVAGTGRGLGPERDLGPGRGLGPGGRPTGERSEASCPGIPGRCCGLGPGNSLQYTTASCSTAYRQYTVD